MLKTEIQKTFQHGALGKILQSVGPIETGIFNEVKWKSECIFQKLKKQIT